MSGFGTYEVKQSKLKTLRKFKNKLKELMVKKWRSIFTR